jgi:radical SAM superfamily enzyme YgiQ (UPF0313 family)
VTKGRKTGDLLWKARKKNRNLLAEETGAVVFSPGARRSFALLYPNVYKIGMTNLGFHIIYREINRRGDTACERFFLPEAPEDGAPLLSVETQRTLDCFSGVGVMLSFELDYFHFLSMLSKGGLTLLAAEREDADPLVVAGGPCATFNPEPLAAVADVFIIGEGEETVNDLLNAWYGSEGQGGRRDRLRKLAELPGVYVPAFYRPLYDGGKLLAVEPAAGAPPMVRRRWVRDIDEYAGWYQIITPLAEFAGMFAVELARGCGRHCRFCVAGYCFRRPRDRSLEKVWQAVLARPAAARQVGLMGAAVCDYPYIKELTGRLKKASIAFSVASLRADRLDVDLAAALAASGQKTLTIAPEAGSERLRAVINKGVTEDDILRALYIAGQTGFFNIKLYFMLGLPTETADDIEELRKLVIKALQCRPGRRIKLSLSVSAFVPKPFTPFQWDDMCRAALLKERLSYLRDAFKREKNVEIHSESANSALVQQALARGDRRTGDALLRAWRDGGLKQFAKTIGGEPVKNYAYGDCLPWEHLTMGFSQEYLWRERQKAAAAEKTRPCFPGCRRCGICEGETDG